LDEGKNLSESLAHHLQGESQSLAVAFQEWIDFALETDHASVMQLPLLCLTYDHLCIIRRGGRVFVIYAHPYHDRAHVARVICHLNHQIHHGPHALVLKNSTCENRIRSVFDPALPLAEAA
jgi:ribosomal protein L36